MPDAETTRVYLNRFAHNGDSVDDRPEPVDLETPHVSDIVDHAVQLVLTLDGDMRSKIAEPSALVLGELKEALEAAGLINQV